MSLRVPMRPAIQGVILDIDGVLEFAGRVYPGAVETLADLRARGLAVCFLTNSTLKSRASAADRLRRRSFSVLPKEVITASYATACFLREQKPRSCLVLLEGEGLREFDDLPHDAEGPEYLVVGDNRSAFNFEDLNRALGLLLGGARLVGMQSELVDHSSGTPQLNVGSWAGMLARAAGVQATYVGKPAAYAFDLALRTLGLARQHVLMVGDKVSTDIAGANAAGIRSVLLRTGEFDERELAGPVRPDYVLDAFRDLPALLDELGS